MSFTNGQTTVTTSATSIDANTSGDYSKVKIHVPSGGQSVFLGNASVSTSNGFELPAGSTVEIDLDPGETLYGIVAATTQVVSHIAFD